MSNESRPTTTGCSLFGFFLNQTHSIHPFLFAACLACRNLPQDSEDPQQAPRFLATDDDPGSLRKRRDGERRTGTVHDEYFLGDVAWAFTGEVDRFFSRVNV